MSVEFQRTDWVKLFMHLFGEIINMFSPSLSFEPSHRFHQFFLKRARVFGEKRVGHESHCHLARLGGLAAPF